MAVFIPFARTTITLHFIFQFNFINSETYCKIRRVSYGKSMRSVSNDFTFVYTTFWLASGFWNKLCRLVCRNQRMFINCEKRKYIHIFSECWSYFSGIDPACVYIQTSIASLYVHGCVTRNVIKIYLTVL